MVDGIYQVIEVFATATAGATGYRMLNKFNLERCAAVLKAWAELFEKLAKLRPDPYDKPQGRRRKPD